MTSPTTTEMELIPGYTYDPEDVTKDGKPTVLQKRYTDGAQHVTSEDIEAATLASLQIQQGEMSEVLNAILVELKVHTYYLQAGLGVADDPETIRSDIQSQL
jgi:hypothetical protein